MEPDRCPSHSPVADRASVGWVGKRDLQLVNPATTCCPDCPILIPPSRRWGGAFPFTGPLAPTQDLPLWSVSLIFTFGRFIHCYSLESHHSKCFYFPPPPTQLLWLHLPRLKKTLLDGAPGCGNFPKWNPTQLVRPRWVLCAEYTTEQDGKDQGAREGQKVHRTWVIGRGNKIP